MKFLIIDDEAEILDLHSMAFSLLAAEAQITTAQSGQIAFDILATQSDFDFVICDFRMPQMNGAQVQVKLLKDYPQIPFVLCSGNELAECPGIETAKLYHFILKPDIMKGVQNLLSIIEQNQQLKPPTQTTEEYLGISPQSLFRMGGMPCDIYVSLSSQKYVKLLHKGDLISKNDESSFAQKNSRLWVKSKDAGIFYDNLTKMLFHLVQDYFTQTSQIHYPHASIEDVFAVSLKDALHYFPADEKVQKLAHQWVAKSLTAIKTSSDLIQKLDEMIKQSKGLYALHINMMNLIGFEILLKCKWETDSIALKISTASLLHDVKMMWTDESELFELERMDKKHPQLGAELARTFKFTPPDVEKIIEEHHELPDGSGFPKGLDASRLSVLSSLFILTHQLSEFYFVKGSSPPPSIKKALEQLNPSFRDSHHFKKIYESL